MVRNSGSTAAISASNAVRSERPADDGAVDRGRTIAAGGNTTSGRSMTPYPTDARRDTRVDWSSARCRRASDLQQPIGEQVDVVAVV
jgi:hypothetical protein